MAEIELLILCQGPWGCVKLSKAYAGQIAHPQAIKSEPEMTGLGEIIVKSRQKQDRKRQNKIT